MIGGLVNLIIYILVLAIILGLAFWVIQEIPLPEPLNRIVRIVIVVVAALVLILLLLQLLGVGIGGLPKLG